MNMILYVIKTSPGNYKADVVPEVIYKDRCKELLKKGQHTIWSCTLEYVDLIKAAKGTNNG